MTTTNPIRVLHVMPQIGTGGAERQLYELIVHSSLDRMQHEVLYYSDSRDMECYRLYDQGGVKYSRIPRNKYRPVKFLQNFAHEIRRRNPDIVHCWLTSGNFWGRLAAMMAGVKNIVITWRSSNVWNPFGMRALEWCTTKRIHHLANSKACARKVAKAIGVSFERFDIIYNGIDLEPYQKPVSRDEVFSDIKVPKAHKIITMVGRLTEAKNYPMLLRIAKRCKDAHLPVDFMIVGHGEKETELKALASELDINDTVHFLGLRMDVPQILKASDAFCYTSWYEGFPNALLEAMAARLPVVTTNFLGVDELVQNDRNGIIVPMEDADAAAQALRMYVENPERAKEYGNNAYLSVESAFSMEKMVEETESLYQKRVKEEK